MFSIIHNSFKHLLFAFDMVNSDFAESLGDFAKFWKLMNGNLAYFLEKVDDTNFQKAYDKHRGRGSFIFREPVSLKLFFDRNDLWNELGEEKEMQFRLFVEQYKKCANYQLTPLDYLPQGTSFLEKIVRSFYMRDRLRPYAEYISFKGETIPRYLSHLRISPQDIFDCADVSVELSREFDESFLRPLYLIKSELNQ